MNVDTLMKGLFVGDVGVLVARLVVVALFVWAIAGAVVFVIKSTRVEKIFGAEFDPENPVDRRKPRK